MPPERELTLLSADELPDGLALFQACFAANGMPKSLDHLRWQFQRSPADARLIMLAIDEPASTVAGIYAVFRSRCRIGALTTRLGAQSLDTITDERYRGRGLFTRLAAKAYDRCQQESVAFVYGFPNGSSAPGFFSKLGWVNLDPVPFLIKPLRAAYFLRRFAPTLAGAWSRRCLPWVVPGATLPPGWQARPWRSFGEEADRIWRAFRAAVGVAVERDAAYLNWRFCQRPATAYQTVAVHDAAGRCRGFVTYICLDKHGGRIGYVMELLAEPADTAAMATLLDLAVTDLAGQGAEVLLAWCLPHSPTRGTFGRAGFFGIPERLRPIELHFGVRPFETALTAFLSDRSNWYLSYADSDTV